MLWGACHFRIAPAGRLMNQLMGPFNGHNVTPDGVLPDRLQHWGRRPSSQATGHSRHAGGNPLDLAHYIARRSSACPQGPSGHPLNTETLPSWRTKRDG
jgi:hypothetical protein